MIGHMGSYEWRSDTHPADRINELEQANINLGNRHCADLDRINELEDALEAIVAMNHTEENEWDAVDRVIPEMVAIATAALKKEKP